MARVRIAHNFTPAEASAKYSTLVHNYSYKPTPKFFLRNREDDRALTFGLEVEAEFAPNDYSMQAIASAAQCVHDIADGRVYMKRDGSVSNGFEIVSHPATLASHMYDAHWSGIINKCIKHGMRSHDAKTWGGSCGLHVHVGLRQLGRDDAECDMVTRKIKILVYRHWDAMVKFSRRSDEQLRMWAARELSADYLNSLAACSDPEQTAADTIGVYNTHSGRYKAINCENAATVEFRLFNGTLKRDTLMATIQLCNNICKYAIAHTVAECLASSFHDVALYERFNEIETYLMARGIADDTCTGRVQNTQRIYTHGGADGVEG